MFLKISDRKVAYNKVAPFVLKKKYGDIPNEMVNTTIWAPEYSKVPDVGHKRPMQL